MRTSPVHYIAPSAISITPNANNSHRDLAVYVAKGAKIKVRCPRAGIGFNEDNTYQEWELSGRNRRLADTTGTIPYTIYARLSTTSKSAYLVFAQMTPEQNGEYMGAWTEAYSHITPDGLYVYGKGSDWEEIRTKPNCIFVRLGDVSAAVNGQRTVTLDTGILGTEEYNSKWDVSPDLLPLRIELGCTIDDEDVGLNPYVYWGQSLVLTATLTEGWTGTDIKRFDHWEILRKSDDNPAESNWIDGIREAAFSNSGEITLRHHRDNDDFNGAVATTFTIVAMGRPEDSDSSDSSDSSSSGEQELVALKTATITILSETIERYELALSANIVGYNPQTQTFSPASITVHIRAADQRGDVFELNKGQFDNAGLAVEYAAVGSTTWTPLIFSGSSTSVATASLNTATAFAAQQSLNVRLVRVIETDSSSSGEEEVIELMQQTIAFVRDGEDSKEREWIFLRSTEAVTFGTQTHPYPASIIGGQVNPTGAATGNDTDSNQDGWVPQGWYDEMQGTNESNPYEYGSYRDYIHDSDSSSSDSSDSSSSNDGGHWGAFSTPKIWSHYGKDGSNGDTPINCYRWYAEGLTPSKPTDTNSDTPAAVDQLNDNTKAFPLTTWNNTADNRPADGWNLYMCQSVKHKSAGGTFAREVWSDPVRISGAKGTPGEDADEREWIYRKNSNVGYASTTGTSNGTAVSGQTDGVYNCYLTDDFVPTNWSDSPVGVSASNDIEYASWRDYDKTTQRWGAFHTPIIWSHYGRNGVDGDGTEYVFIRTKTNVAPVIKADSSIDDDNNNDYTDSYGHIYINEDFRPVAHVSSGEIETNDLGLDDSSWSGDNSNNDYGECTDNPKGISSQWPYEWVMKRSKADANAAGSRSWNVYSGTMSLWAKRGEDGTSPWVADLDNEMDSVVCDTSGEVSSNQAVSTNVSLCYGSTPKPFLVEVFSDAALTNAYTNGVEDVGVTVSWISGNNSSNTIQVALSQGDVTINGKIVFYIRLTAQENNTVQRILCFTVNGIRPGTKGTSPTIYNLLPSVSQISVGRDASGGYDPSAASITCGYTARTGDSPMTTVSDATGQIGGAYYIFFRKRARGGTWQNSYYRYDLYKNSAEQAYTLSGFHVATYDAVEFIICTATASFAASTIGSYIVIDRDIVPVVSDGAQGTHGTIYQRMYRSTNSGTWTGSLPADYVDGSNSWSIAPTSMTSNARYRWVTERRSDDGGSSWGSGWSTPQIDAYLADDGTSFSIKGHAVLVIPSGDNYSVDGKSPNDLEDDDYLDDASVVQEGDYVLYNNSEQSDKAFLSGSAFVDDQAYASAGDGYIDLDGHLWTRNSTGLRWTDCGQIKGDKGDDSVTYTLAVDPACVNFNTNAVGEFAGPATVAITATAIKNEGQKTPVIGNSGTYQVFVRTETTNTSTGIKSNSAWSGAYNSKTYTLSKSDAINATTPITSVQFKLAISDSGSAIATATVPVTLGGRRGEEGALGKMFFPMGEWVERAYYRTDDRVPLVHYGTAWSSDLQIYGSYYYLNTSSASSSDVPGISEKWTLCNDFGVVITQGLFAEFAKLGSAIMSGDYMFSMNGRIGSTEFIEGQTYTAGDVTRPAYTWFKGDPSQQTGTFFTPNWWVDLKTGKMSASRGNFVVNGNGDTYIKGEVHATSGEFNDVVVYGSSRNPFVTGDPSWNWSDSDKEVNDNFIVTSGNGYSTAYPIPCTARQSGRMLTIVNKSANAATLQCMGSEGVFLDGTNTPATSIRLPGKAMVQLLGLGTATTFYGWLVVNRQTYNFDTLSIP